KFTVYSAVLRGQYGATRPPAGGALLVMDVEFENIIPLTLIYEKQVPTEYQVPNLADHMYVVADGARLARLRPDAGDLPGHVRVKDFNLPRIGAKARGNLVFDLPQADPKTIELRFYDYAHGHMTVRLAGTDAAYAALPQVKPLK